MRFSEGPDGLRVIVTERQEQKSMNNNKEIFDALTRGDDIYARLRCAHPDNVQDFLKIAYKIAVPYDKCEQLSELLTVYLILKKGLNLNGADIVMESIETYIENMELE